jgi:hypothetical protein
VLLLPIVGNKVEDSQNRCANTSDDVSGTESVNC